MICLKPNCEICVVMDMKKQAMLWVILASAEARAGLHALRIEICNESYATSSEEEADQTE